MITGIGTIAIELLKKSGDNCIGYNEFGLLIDVFSDALERGLIKDIGCRGGCLRSHPLNKHQVVLNALDRDCRFEKFYINCCGSGREARVREFRIKEGVIV